jgi:uncharacterized protein YhbP (UPF0306 family)
MKGARRKKYGNRSSPTALRSTFTNAVMNINLINPDFPNGKLLRSVFKILKKTELWSMATVGPDNESHISTAYFSYNDSLDFYFVSDPSTKHIQNIARTPGVAITVFDSRQPWDSYHRGLQLFGKCWSASTAQSVKAFAVHAARFQAYGDYIRALSAKERKSSPYRFYVFRPDRIKILDERAFGEEVFVLADVVRNS